jgi:hypothetical protein
MKNNLKEPCVECPFKKESAPGWLGGETAEDTFRHIKAEADFACHLTRDKKLKEMSRCRGSMLFMRKSGQMPRYNTQLAKDLQDMGKPDTSAILSVPEFFKHHGKFDT